MPTGRRALIAPSETISHGTELPRCSGSSASLFPLRCLTSVPIAGTTISSTKGPHDSFTNRLALEAFVSASLATVQDIGLLEIKLSSEFLNS